MSNDDIYGSRENEWKSFITHPTAKAAAEIGYKEYCTECYCISAHYDNEDESGPLIPDLHSIPFSTYYGLIPDYALFECFRPEQNQLQKWLRDIHDIYIDVYTDKTWEPKFCFAIYKLKPKTHEWINILAPRVNSDLYYSYHKALEDALYQSVLYIKNSNEE